MPCRVRIAIALTAVALVACLTGTAHPQWVNTQATNELENVWGPALASSDEGLTVLGYMVSGGVVLQDFARVVTFPTLAGDNLILPDPVTLTSGNHVELCFSRTGFYAAVLSGGAILVYHADRYGNWDLNDPHQINGYGEVINVDLYGVPGEGTDPDVFLVLESWLTPPYGERHVQFVMHDDEGWTMPMTIAINEEIEQFPQVTWEMSRLGPMPTVFYYDGGFELPLLHQRTLDWEQGWLDPVALPEPSPFAMEFDVVTHGLMERHVLGLGLQPVCPCNQIYHQACDPAQGWLAYENMTEGYAEYDWPMSPQLAVDGEGRVHAFWYQEARGYDFTFWNKTLEYKVLEEGAWSDAGDFLQPGNPRGNGLGSEVAIAALPGDFPVLAWTRLDTIDQVPQPEQVFISRIFDASPAQESPVPEAGLDLTAWPNPFNPSVKIAFSGGSTREVRVDIFDTRGRLVRNLLDTVVGSGRTVLEWNGKDDAGREAPSGIYFARVVSGGRKSVTKLVLAE